MDDNGREKPCCLLKAGMWPVRRSLASRKPMTDKSEMDCGLDAGSADPAVRLQARSPRS
ncbi:hypothetical protein [Pseudovibrio sp. Ad14]|uniref:hypothetical protein n=1 Tax=Pseudovibrio sp. Ad14 TaxID=989397 RepID=UPI00187D6A4A|nr:hypothetical protein [Pseudovibrio sp. Ad14]